MIMAQEREQTEDPDVTLADRLFRLSSAFAPVRASLIRLGTDELSESTNWDFYEKRKEINQVRLRPLFRSSL